MKQSQRVDLGGLRMREDFEDREPRIRDLELAVRLGYERPRKIRELIERLLSDGKLSASGVCPTVGQTSDKGGRPSTEFWLDERACLKLIAKSETPSADAILDEVIDVFMAYRRGKLMPRLLADEPCEWDPMWTVRPVSALCHLYGQPYTVRFPVFLASVMQKLYKLVLEPATYAEMKVRIPEPRHGENLHQLLTEQARERFRKELVVIEGTALSCASIDEFWSRLERVYLGHPLQLPLMGLPRNLLPA